MAYAILQGVNYDNLRFSSLLCDLFNGCGGHVVYLVSVVVVAINVRRHNRYGFNRVIGS